MSMEPIRREDQTSKIFLVNFANKNQQNVWKMGKLSWYKTLLRNANLC